MQVSTVKTTQESLSLREGPLYLGNEIVFLGNLFSLIAISFKRTRCKNKMMQMGELWPA